MFTNDRDKIRQYYFDVWNKFNAGQPLEPLEKIIADVIKLHPEYHPVLDGSDKNLGKEYLPEMGETNPFLHMGMHIAIHEQMSTNRPAGICDIYQTLLKKLGNPHDVEHKMMDCLGEMMWQAQRQGVAPDEANYLNSLRQLCLN